jgi:hypothetical protein
MVRSRWIKAVMASVVSTGLAWGQASAPALPKAPDDATGRIITVNEAGKPPQKCRVVKVWVDEKGNKVWQVEALDSGEVMTIVAEGAPHMGEPPPAGRPKSLRTTIFHWNRDRTPPPGAPLPPAVVCNDCTPSAPVVTTGPRLPVITSVPSGGQTTVIPCPACTTTTVVNSGTPCPTCPPVGGTTVVTSTGGSWGAPSGTACDSCKPTTGTTVISGGWGQPGTTGTGSGQPGTDVRTPVIVSTPGPSVTTTTPPKPTDKGGTKVAQAEPSLLEKWRESWGKSSPSKLPADGGKTADTKKPTTDATKGATAKADGDKGTDPKKSATDTSKGNDPKKTTAEPKEASKSAPPKVDLPHVDPKKPDPLLGDPTQYSRKPLDEKLPAKGELPPAELPRVAGGDPSAAAGRGGAPVQPGAGEALPAGSRSVTDSGSVESVPHPVMQFPLVKMGPPPVPHWQVPQAPNPVANPGRGNAPEAHPGGMAYNAFSTPENIPPAPGSAAQAQLGNAFSSVLDSPPAPQGMPGGAPAAGVFGLPGPPNPMMMGQGGRPTNPMLPPTPYGPVVRLPGTPSPAGQGPSLAMLPLANGGVTQVGYQAPAPAAPSLSAPQLTTMLHDSLYPSQREWAAEKLAMLDWKQNEPAVQALTQAVREDPAATVRATCIRSLARMKVDSYGAVSAIQAAKKDSDIRVRTEADEALGVMAPGAVTPVAPPAAVSPVIQPVSAVVPAPAPAPAPKADSSPALPPLPN